MDRADLFIVVVEQRRIISIRSCSKEVKDGASFRRNVLCARMWFGTLRVLVDLPVERGAYGDARILSRCVRRIRSMKQLLQYSTVPGTDGIYCVQYLVPVHTVDE